MEDTFYIAYDGRWLTEPDRALVMFIEDTLEEAYSLAKGYGYWIVEYACGADELIEETGSYWWSEDNERNEMNRFLDFIETKE